MAVDGIKVTSIHAQGHELSAQRRLVDETSEVTQNRFHSRHIVCSYSCFDLGREALGNVTSQGSLQIGARLQLNLQRGSGGLQTARSLQTLIAILAQKRVELCAGLLAGLLLLDEQTCFFEQLFDLRVYGQLTFAVRGNRNRCDQFVLLVSSS